MAALLLLAAALACSGIAGALLGTALAKRVSRARARARGKGPALEEALEDPLLLFVLLASVSAVAAVAFGPWGAVPCLLAAALLARKAPSWMARRRAQALRDACEQHLDMLCDIVAMGAEAGLSFDSAVELYCSRFSNPLAEKLEGARQQWTHGVVSRSQALQDLAASVGSPGLKRFADTAVPAVEQGAPLAGMLRRLAAELRQGRRTSMERKVARAPVKMLVPTGVCIVPAMLLLVMGPMLLQFMGNA